MSRLLRPVPISPQVTSKAQRPYRLCRENHTEISHIFLQLGKGVVMRGCSPDQQCMGCLEAPAAGSGSLIQHRRGELIPHCPSFCFLFPVARSHPSELLGIFHQKLEMGRGDTRVGILALMSAVIAAEGRSRGARAQRLPLISCQCERLVQHGAHYAASGPVGLVAGPWACPAPCSNGQSPRGPMLCTLKLCTLDH